jgi:hypothetical protein
MTLLCINRRSCPNSPLGQALQFRTFGLAEVFGVSCFCSRSCQRSGEARHGFAETGRQEDTGEHPSRNRFLVPRRYRRVPPFVSCRPNRATCLRARSVAKCLSRHAHQLCQEATGRDTGEVFPAAASPICEGVSSPRLVDRAHRQAVWIWNQTNLL